MKRLWVWGLRGVGFAGATLGLLTVGYASYLRLAKPSVRRPSPEKVEATAERVARGKYLFRHVANCAGCHSEHVFVYGFPVKPGTEGSGDCWDARLGYEAPLCASNLTSEPKTGLGQWTDGEILRALREGVNALGQALALAMPYPRFRNLGDEDARAVLAYVRSLQPVEKVRPRPTWGVLEDLFLRTAPMPLEGPVPTPSRADALAYGKYLVQLAQCAECHGEDLGGGEARLGPSGPEVPGNLTPAPATGLSVSREAFIGRFKAFENLVPAPDADVRVHMPWVAFSGMEEEDLGLIYDYLRTLPPVTRAPAGWVR